MSFVFLTSAVIVVHDSYEFISNVYLTRTATKILHTYERIFLFRCASTECADILNNDAEKTINVEALERNLASFGLERNIVASDGNCCFSSIVSQLYKIKESETMSQEYTDFITELGKMRDPTKCIREVSILKRCPYIIRVVHSGKVSILERYLSELERCPH